MFRHWGFSKRTRDRMVRQAILGHLEQTDQKWIIQTGPDAGRDVREILREDLAGSEPEDPA